jgi:hypothetical protein
VGDLLLKLTVLLTFVVLSGACGGGEIGAGGASYDTPIGEPRSDFDPAEVDPDFGPDADSEIDVIPPDGGTPIDPPPPPDGDPDRPWAHNTGPKDANALVPSGALTLSSPGVYENLDITGDIYITSSNVTVRNFRVNASGIQRGVWIEPGLSDIVLEDGEIFGMTSIGIYGIGYTARRLHIHDSGGDALRPEGSPGAGPTLVEYCFVERMGLSPSAHADALQVSNVSEGSYNVTLQFNNFYMPAPGTPGHPGDTSKASAVIFLEKPVTNYVIQNNWLDGGGYTIYCGGNTGGVLWRDNVFGHDYSFGAVTGTCQNWSGNVWEDTGAPL